VVAEKLAVCGGQRRNRVAVNSTAGNRRTDSEKLGDETSFSEKKTPIDRGSVEKKNGLPLVRL
jgi:hypothetical protein